MTSEADNKPGRRPPTIELTAKEVEAEKPASPSSGTSEPKADAKPGAEAGTAADMPGKGKSGTFGSAPRPIIAAIAGAVLIVAIGAGLWFIGYLPVHRSVASSSSPTIDALTARLNDIQRQLRARPSGSTQPDPALETRIAADETKTKSLGDSLAALDRRLDEIAAASQTAVKQADAAQATAEAARSESQSASQSVSQAAGQAANQSNVQHSDLDALSNRIAALESTVRALSETAAHPAPSANDKAARLGIAAEALRSAVERGASYESELAALQSLGVPQSATASLQPFAATGIPSIASLAHELQGLTSALALAAQAPAAATSFLGRIETDVRHLVRITPVDAPAGNTPAAVISRIEIDADRADIGAALKDIAALPETAKPIAAGWVEKARSREAALAASRQIVANAFSGLSKPAAQ